MKLVFSQFRSSNVMIRLGCEHMQGAQIQIPVLVCFEALKLVTFSEMVHAFYIDKPMSSNFSNKLE